VNLDEAARFSEPDEDPARIAGIFDTAPHGVTTPPQDT
jgi:hypothetical protein